MTTFPSAEVAMSALWLAVKRLFKFSALSESLKGSWTVKKTQSPEENVVIEARILSRHLYTPCVHCRILFVSYTLYKVQFTFYFALKMTSACMRFHGTVSCEYIICTFRKSVYILYIRSS